MSDEKDSDSSSQSGKNKDSIRLFVHDVAEFSSQYGKENTNSYTIANIRARPHYFPKYGDFLESSVLRTYGPWWKSSFKIPVNVQPQFISNDYIEVIYEHKLLVQSVVIYETYNPGAVCTIYAYDYKQNKWILLWSIFEEYKSNIQAINRTLPSKNSRKFEPNLIRTDIFTDKIRVEFEHSQLEYYTELDAIELVGLSYDHPSTKLVASNLKHTADMLMNCMSMNSMLHISDNNEKSALAQQAKQNFQSGYNFNRRKSSLGSLSEKNIDMTSCSNLVDLPNEILCMILSYLDLKTVSRLRSTCQTFYELCSLDFTYNKLDLQPYWNLIDENFINLLSCMTDKITMLNLSWLKINKNSIERLFTTSCYNLTVLQLNSCTFMNGRLLTEVTKNCSKLTHLSLQSCVNIGNLSDEVCDGFIQIKTLRNLKYLDLYRTQCDQKAICEILSSCTEIEYLNLGACIKIQNFDKVMTFIGSYLKNIKCLDLWRAYSLTVAGVKEISENCLDLEELDIGWCRSVAPIRGIQALVTNCRNLRKLYLTSLKVTDAELIVISKYSSKLEKLDILGSNLVTYEGVEKVLAACKNLKMFDISFCPDINNVKHKFLSEVYTKCNIKKSFQSEI